SERGVASAATPSAQTGMDSGTTATGARGSLRFSRGNARSARWPARACLRDGGRRRAGAWTQIGRLLSRDGVDVAIRPRDERHEHDLERAGRVRDITESARFAQERRGGGRRGEELRARARVEEVARRALAHGVEE